MSTTTFTPPYARSWVDRMLDGIERIPGPTWLFYTGLFAVLVVMGHWFAAPNYPNIPGWMFTTITGYILVGTHWLRGRSRTTVERLRPALDLDDPEASTLAYRLAYTPPKAAWVALAMEAVYLPFYALSEAEPFGYRELPLPILIPGLIGWFIGEAVAWAFLYQTVRRLVIISQVHRSLRGIELFRQQPLHSSSGLTMPTAVVMLLLFGYVPLLSLGSEAFTDPFYLYSLLGGAVGAVVVAVLPLTGTHNRIVAEKRRRAMANGKRIETTLFTLQGAVDGRDQPLIDTEQKALAALLTERDLIAKVGTWPWAPGTVRTFATTILVPVFLLLANRIADRWFG